MENQPVNKEQQLWEEARERVRFKRKLMMYIVMCAFFWIIWYFTQGRYEDTTVIFKNGFIPWPAWVMLGWGLGLIFRYIRIHHTATNAVEKEYQKLKDKRGI